MSFQILNYRPDTSLKNAPVVPVTVQVEEPGEEVRVLQLVATDADARSICKMVRNPEFNGKPGPEPEGDENGVDEMMATGEIDFAQLQAFVQRKLDEAKAPTAPATVAARMQAAADAEKVARQAEFRRLSEENAAEAARQRAQAAAQAEQASKDAVLTMTARLSTMELERVVLDEKLVKVRAAVETEEQRLVAKKKAQAATPEAKAPPPDVPKLYPAGSKVKVRANPKFQAVVQSATLQPGGRYLHEIKFSGGHVPTGSYWGEDLISDPPPVALPVPAPEPAPTVESDVVVIDEEALAMGETGESEAFTGEPVSDHDRVTVPTLGGGEGGEES